LKKIGKKKKLPKVSLSVPDRLESNLCLKDSATVIWNVLRPFLSSLTGGERREQQGTLHKDFSKEQGFRSNFGTLTKEKKPLGSNMGTVLSFSPREKTPPYALDYTNPINNINYETINNLKNKEILINNENAHLLVEKSALEKNLKKHSMFINALSWKKFNTNKKKANEGSSKHKGLPFRTPLDNIHPVVDNNKNIQNALCHGSKNTSLVDSKRSLDIVRTVGSVGSGTKTFSHQVPPQQNPTSQQQKPFQTQTTNANVLQNSKLCNINNNNNTVTSFQQNTTDQTDNYQNNLKRKSMIMMIFSKNREITTSSKQSNYPNLGLRKQSYRLVHPSC